VIVEVPAATPVTTPVDATTVAFAGVLLLQVAPVGVLPSVVVCPTHTPNPPVITVGIGFTVIIVVAVLLPGYR
jgi:hypothetical protein